MSLYVRRSDGVNIDYVSFQQQSPALEVVNDTDSGALAWLTSTSNGTVYPPSQHQLALTALDEADITMLRIGEAVALGSNTWLGTDVVAWVNYRRSLRSVVSSGTGSLPSKPAYPAGT